MNTKTNRELLYESSLERDLAYILVVHPDVVDVHDQPAPVDYFDGAPRKHTFDYRAVRKSGRRTAIAVKPAKRVDSSGLAAEINLIRAQAPEGFAEEFVIRTEEHITRVRADNARLIHRARRTRDSEDVAAVAIAVSNMEGATAISSLVVTSTNSGDGFFAVICLIDDGVLQHLGTGRITYDSLVQRISHGED